VQKYWRSLLKASREYHLAQLLWLDLVLTIYEKLIAL
jgi:hypothetical protein